MENNIIDEKYLKLMFLINHLYYQKKNTQLFLSIALESSTKYVLRLHMSMHLTSLNRN